MPKENPNLMLSRRARLMIRYAVHTHPNKEVLGFGKCELGDDGDVWVTDIIIPPHEVTSTAVDLKPETIEQLMAELAKNGMTLSQWPLWWHSHANMGVAPSGTDENTLNKLAIEFGGVAFGLVTNNDDSYYGWYSVAVDTKWGKFTSSNAIAVYYERDEDEHLKQLVDGMMEHVTEKKWQAPSQTALQEGKRGNRRGKGGYTTAGHSVVYDKQQGAIVLPQGWEPQDYEFYRLLKESEAENLTDDEKAMSVVDYGLKVIREGGPVLFPFEEV